MSKILIVCCFFVLTACGGGSEVDPSVVMPSAMQTLKTPSTSNSCNTSLSKDC